MIATVSRLNDHQIKELEQLVELCQKEDKGTPAIYWYLLSKPRDTHNTALYYHNEQLIGIISIYFFYENACEISLLIAPAFRRQGMATQLLATMYPLLQMTDMHKLIFSAKAAFGENWLPNHGFIYDHSEYHMERYSAELRFIEQPKLSIKIADHKDIADLFALDSSCFAAQAVNMMDRFTFLLESSEYTILIAIYEDKIIGKAHLQWREDNTMLSDIAIFPEYQGQGFGSELIALSMNYAMNQGKSRLALDVETKNQGALNIYKRLGFKTTSTYDFWSIETSQLYQGLTGA